MEGFLPLGWCVFWYLLSIPVVAWGVHKVRVLFRENPENKLMVAISGAFIFVLSSLKLPSVTGSSSHPTGTGVSTMLYGVGITSVLTVIVLVFQALLLAHGGITTLGANVFSMGVAGPFAAYLVYKGLQKLHLRITTCAFVVAFISDLVTYTVTATQLALAFPSNGSVLASWQVFMSIFAITQIPLAIVEGILTAMFFSFLAESRPEMLKEGMRTAKSRLSRKARYALASVTVVVVIAAMAVARIIGLEGSDNAGSNAIFSIDPNYIPWAGSFLNLSEPMEILLFAVQGIIGLAIIGYAWRYFKRKKEERVEKS